MRIATWNVNSLRVRLDALLPWLAEDGPEVLCLQETKVTDDLFPLDTLTAAGYQAVFTGQKTYNGVAILSRLPITDVLQALPGAPPEDEKRFIAGTIAGVRIINVYVPNGQAVGSPKFHYKLAWLQALQAFLAGTYRAEDSVLICGDFNIAPEARDVYDESKAEGEILCHPEERAAFAALLALGLHDTLRLHHAEGGLYSWWDYRAMAFRRNMGYRIDHILVTAPLAARCTEVTFARDLRKLPKPSDHIPVIAAFREA
ncbi:MAG: exodeoxyribonuclease III [Candidatus Tectomicrobia bacterium]|uniref:Exodeoxyribonuclease III n=1 Tax=Tectimicrobiota bacterium TaxID=2528274 RepID=A0A938B4Y1_UNCTE|nr:exodeoxyribonuclease III [Candidatus Tectomicrobia bacterium]